MISELAYSVDRLQRLVSYRNIACERPTAIAGGGKSNVPSPGGLDYTHRKATLCSCAASANRGVNPSKEVRRGEMLIATTMTGTGPRDWLRLSIWGAPGSTVKPYPSFPYVVYVTLAHHPLRVVCIRVSFEPADSTQATFCRSSIITPLILRTRLAGVLKTEEHSSPKRRQNIGINPLTLTVSAKQDASKVAPGRSESTLYTIHTIHTLVHEELHARWKRETKSLGGKWPRFSNFTSRNPSNSIGVYSIKSSLLPIRFGE